LCIIGRAELLSYPPLLEKPYDMFLSSSNNHKEPCPVLYQTRGQGFGSWVSCGPFWEEEVEEEVVVVEDTVDRPSQADKLPQAGMPGKQDMQEPVELPEPAAEEGSHLSLPPGNTRSLPM
jgi:hypothetical protein